MKNTIKLLLILGIVQMSVHAQVTMVSDIYSGANNSTPDYLFATADKVYFTAEHPTFGVEIWEMTSTGSVILNHEVNSTGSSSNSGHFAEFNGKVYFQGYEGTYGSELYEYDGVNAPVRISDINPGGANSIPSFMTVFDNKLYFYAAGPSNDYELYVYDGVNPPTLVANINVTGSSYPSELTVFNNKLIFSANDGINGIELWMYDGVNAPSMIADINPGANGSNPSFDKYYLKEFNGALYFGADNGTNGVELWMYDGVNAPSMVVDFEAGAASFSPKYFHVYQNKLVFSAVDPTLGAELWQYDGVNNPTMVFDINTNPSIGLHNSHPRHFIEYNGILYFRATDELHGRELWGWNGVTDPEMIEDINPGTANSSEDWNLNATKRMVVFNGSLIFAADNGVVGEELFKYDGCLVSASVVQNGITLEANQTGTSYQWIDCSTGNAISGETNNTFTPTVDGEYKVVITDGLCIDTSACFTFSGLSIDEKTGEQISVYPNPTSDILTISFMNQIDVVNVYSIDGKLILSSAETTFSVKDFPSGIFVIEVSSENTIYRTKFLKN